MATVKVKFRASSVEMKEGSLYYQVIHNRLVRQVHTGYRLFPSEWDAGISEVVVASGTEEGRRNYPLSMKTAIADDLSRLRSVIARLERSDTGYTADKVVEVFSSPADCGGFLSFARQLIQELKKIGKRRTAETYTTALNSFLRFRGERDLLFEEVDSNLMVEYETFLKGINVCPNSSSFYMRNLRAIYNRAVERELTVQRYPFKHVYTGVDKTVKRAVPLKVIRRIRDLDLTLSPVLDYARDLFMFSFYTRGMAFVDMAYLKKKDLQNGVLVYRRQKTGQQLFIKWEKPMQEIVGKYDTSATPYLLPIIRDMDTDARKQYKNAAHLVNDKLKKIGRQVRACHTADKLCRAPRLGFHRKEQEHSDFHHQRSDGTRFGEYHAYLPCLIRHIGRGQGQQPYSKITVIGRKICIIPAHRTDSKKAIRKMAIETEKLCNLKHLFLRKIPFRKRPGFLLFIF